MSISPYIAGLRAKVGSARLLLPSVAAIIYDAHGSILLVRQRDGGDWSTPGGAIEPDEHPADAVVRETWEETGLLVQPVRLLGVFGGPGFVVRYPNGDVTQYVSAVFECTPIAGALDAVNDEVTEARFIPESALAALPLSSWARPVLPLLYARRDAPIIGEVLWRPPV